jgi:hypothetical protein
MAETEDVPYHSGALSTQLNIVTTIDVAGVLEGRPVDDCVWMTDNSPESTGKGTAALQTACHTGQVLNWLIYSLDVEQRPDGTFPPIARILNIVFYSGDLENPVPFRASDELKVYGAPDRIRSPYTPVYAYWAGMVPLDATADMAHYRLNVEIPSLIGGRPGYIEISKPSLVVHQGPSTQRERAPIDLGGTMAPALPSATLAGDVGDEIRIALDESGRGDVHDDSAAGGRHGRRNGADAEEHSGEVDADDPIPFGEVSLVDRREADDAGVVDENVDESQ